MAGCKPNSFRACSARCLAAAAVLYLSVLPSSTSYRHPDWRVPGSRWATGPVWYLMTDAEYGSFRALRTEPQRRQFIREFWERRDPLPATEENELERTFWERVRIGRGSGGRTSGDA